MITHLEREMIKEHATSAVIQHLVRERDEARMRVAELEAEVRRLREEQWSTGTPSVEAGRVYLCADDDSYGGATYWLALYEPWGDGDEPRWYGYHDDRPLDYVPARWCPLPMLFAEIEGGDDE